MDDSFENDVFISYSHANKELVRERVVQPLKKAGLYVWWDELVEPGSSLLTQIEEGITSSRKTLVILTKEYLDAKTGWLEFEALLTRTLAIAERSQRLLVIRYGDVEVPGKYKNDVYCIAQNEEELQSKIQEIIRQLRPNPIPAVRFSTGGRVLAIGAHWDDMLLGSLGFLIKLKILYRYQVDLLVLCTTYNAHYYGVDQIELDRKAHAIYQQVSEECAFNNLDAVLHAELRRHQNKAIHDRLFREEIPLIGRVLVDVIERSKKSPEGPYNLILCPPMDDMNEDHAVVGSAVFSHFREPEHTILEYPIKRYTDRVFVPNLCIGLDDPIAGPPKSQAVADEKVRIVNDICRITDNICKSERLFTENALRARMKMHAVDYAKNKLVEYAEIFRGRFEL